jgi:hypothetical protein
LPSVGKEVQKAFVTAKSKSGGYDVNMSNCSNVDLDGSSSLNSEALPAAKTGCFEPVIINTTILQAREDNKLGLFISEILEGSKAGFAKAAGEAIASTSTSTVIDTKMKIATACAAYLAAKAEETAAGDDVTKQSIAKLKMQSLKYQVENLRLVIGENYQPDGCTI